MRRATVLILGCAAVAYGCDNKPKVKITATNNDTPPPVASGPPSGGGGGGSSSGGSGGAVQAVRGAVQRIVDQNEMRNIHLFIENASASTGQMPRSADTLAALRKDAAKTAQKVDDGVITLCSPRSRVEIWAYETDALQKGGWVCSGSGVERMDAATLKQKLGK